jgi:hypothetical protein
MVGRMALSWGRSGRICKGSRRGVVRAAIKFYRIRPIIACPKKYRTPLRGMDSWTCI